MHFWNKLDARVLPKSSIRVPRCFDLLIKIVPKRVLRFLMQLLLESVSLGWVPNPPRCFIEKHFNGFYKSSQNLYCFQNLLRFMPKARKLRLEYERLRPLEGNG